jgi:hypothetical protein
VACNPSSRSVAARCADGGSFTGAFAPGNQRDLVCQLLELFLSTMDGMHGGTVASPGSNNKPDLALHHQFSIRTPLPCSLNPRPTSQTPDSVPSLPASQRPIRPSKEPPSGRESGACHGVAVQLRHAKMRGRARISRQINFRIRPLTGVALGYEVPALAHRVAWQRGFLQDPEPRFQSNPQF